MLIRRMEGGPLPAGPLFVAREEREYRKLHVGDVVEEGQLLGIVDENAALHDLAVQIAKLETAEADYRAAVKAKEEAERRAKESERLFIAGHRRHLGGRLLRRHSQRRALRRRREGQGRGTERRRRGSAGVA